MFLNISQSNLSESFVPVVFNVQRDETTKIIEGGGPPCKFFFSKVVDSTGYILQKPSNLFQIAITFFVIVAAAATTSNK